MLDLDILLDFIQKIKIKKSLSSKNEFSLCSYFLRRGNGCLDLKSLNLRGCTSIKSEGILRVLETCTKIASLSVKLCEQLTDDAFALSKELRLDHLTFLDLQGCTKLTDESLYCLTRAAPKLSFLDVRGFQHLFFV